MVGGIMGGDSGMIARLGSAGVGQLDRYRVVPWPARLLRTGVA
jgi:hypothetical protein